MPLGQRGSVVKGFETESVARRRLGRATEFIQTQVWIWPIVAAIALSALGLWLRHAIEGVLKQQLATELQTILNADVAALQMWFHSQEIKAKHLATEAVVYDRVKPLLALAQLPGTQASDFTSRPEQAALRLVLNSSLDSLGYGDFFIASPNGHVVAGSRDEAIGKTTEALFGSTPWLQRTWAGFATVSPPFLSRWSANRRQDESQPGAPTMVVTAPILDDAKRVVAALFLSLDPAADYIRILQVARQGQSGETLAFDINGKLLSESRFDELLAADGLLPRGVRQSMLNLELRNPQVNLTRGERPGVNRDEQPLVEMVAAAVQGHTGLTVDGFRDYRGVWVVGAWTWLADYGIGIGTQMDRAEAYRPLYVIRRAILGLLSVLALAAGAVYLLMLAISHAQRRAREAELEARRLGPYTLVEKLGAGGMGEVYRAQHALLRRPTAIKLLRLRATTTEDIVRFEHEVQSTSRLNHPNTVAIYDFGRTPEGILYYAMEYLDGISLDQLVAQYGPQPEGRVIHILQQICAALAEAHSVGLVHRDIKPANVMINQRGGLFDFVKVLDFGLVKAIKPQPDTVVPSSDIIFGTPAYLAPEAIQNAEAIDARSDLYAVGAVGYFLLTGTALFEGQSPAEICLKQLNEFPLPPSRRVNHPISSDLEKVILWCLAKKKEGRPSDADALRHELSRCAAARDWTPDLAATWWRHHIPPQIAPETLETAPCLAVPAS
jgi:eukaryotic-like serine/threonine-protein kinase